MLFIYYKGEKVVPWTKPKKLDIKCEKCKYYYRSASLGGGYNPFPCCHRFEDIGERGNPLTFYCFEKKLRRK